MPRDELPTLDWSGRYLQHDDGAWEMVDDDGFVDALPAIYQTPDFGMYDAGDRFIAAVREWGES